MGRNDDAWALLFERYSIAEQVRANGFFLISADQIRQYREPRLMTKFDHIVSLPALFVENGLAVLPVSRGDYIISSFAAYHCFEEPAGETARAHLPAHLQSLASQYLTSEAVALNCAHACGVLDDFLGEEGLTPTASGRMGSGRFDFTIDSARGPLCVPVRNAQIEIDAAYEGSHTLSLFEAKSSRSHDFLIRQLYYPFRTWRSRIHKPVRTVFFIFTGGVFYLYEYGFANPEHYNSLFLLRQKNYRLDAGISLPDIERLLQTAVVRPEPAFPFPQADSFERIINLLELLAVQPMNGEDIAGQYLFTPRQSGYYTNAGRYLGLIQMTRTPYGPVFSLTPRGTQLFCMDLRQRRLALAEVILEHGVFNQLLRLRLSGGRPLDKNTAVQVMRQSRLRGVDSDSTYARRASTVLSWLRWILDIVEN